MQRRSALATVAVSALALPVNRRIEAQTLEKVSVIGGPTEDSTNMYYGIKNGVFKRAGLDLDWTFASSGTAATTAVIAGSYDVAKASNIAVFSAHLRDIPILMVAPAFEYNYDNMVRSPFAALQVATDSSYKVAADLNGQTLGVAALGDITQIMIEAWVDKNGGDWRSLKFIETGYPALEPAIVQKRIAAGILLQPQLDLSLADSRTRTLGLAAAAIAPAYTAGAYVSMTDWVAHHGDELRKFNRALNESSTYVGAHLAETAPLVAELTKLDLSAVAKLHRTKNPTTLNASLIQPLIDAAFKYGHLPRTFPAREILWSGLK